MGENNKIKLKGGKIKYSLSPPTSTYVPKACRVSIYPDAPVATAAHAKTTGRMGMSTRPHTTSPNKGENKIGPQDQSQPNFRQRQAHTTHTTTTRTRRRFQHNAPLTQHRSTPISVGGVAETCKPSSMVRRLSWVRLIVALSQAASTFRLTTKQHSTNDNSCYSSSFGHANRAISVISIRYLSDIYEPTR